tara:strand:+ start:79 stop:198 length:120 start_codon:yes stop_codon:yes gene_type:complete
MIDPGTEAGLINNINHQIKAQQEELLSKQELAEPEGDDK